MEKFWKLVQTPLERFEGNQRTLLAVRLTLTFAMVAVLLVAGVSIARTDGWPFGVLLAGMAFAALADVPEAISEYRKDRDQ